jgi:calcineurin-like phosphoesterase family protein
MRTWFTSDHHFGHANIIKLCHRPFTSVEHMHAYMLEAWNRVVAPDDEVNYLGDFAMKAHLALQLLPQLNGTKVLIAGNHDPCHPQIGNPKKWLQTYLDAGFTSVHTEMELKIAGQRVLLHHFPYRTDPTQKYYAQRPVNNGGWLVHGHVHDRWKVSGKQINVSVENWNCEPVPLETIAQIINQGDSPP